jgi:hypothetical protein
MWKFEYKYKIDEEHKTIVALSTFAGKPVAGVARCAPEDTFDIEAGKKLAAARCGAKIAEKRMKYAEKCSVIAEEYAEYWNAYRAKMENYERDSAKAYLDAVAELVELEDTFA